MRRWVYAVLLACWLGSEAGERRAYFTETVSGTICDLDIYALDQMTIYATNPLPPGE